MEILGGVASSVALGQAIGAGRHIVRLVHEIPEIQHEFNELKQDISLITAMLNDVQSASGSSLVSGATGSMLLERTARRLEEINNELQGFVEHCGRGSPDNTTRAKKRKWIMQSDKLQKLREKAMDAKMNLHFALTSQSRGLVCEQVSALQHQFEMFTIHMSNRRPPEASLLIDFSDSSEDEKSKRPESEAAEPASPPDSSTQPQLTRRDENTSPAYITAMRISRCSHLCRCRCHSSQNRSRKANWAIPFIGSLLVEYRSAPRTQQAACSHKHCSATTDTAFEFKYYPPAWLWEGMVSFGASYHKAIGLQVALRPKRVLPPINPFFLSIIGPFENFCDAIRTGFLRVYPDDELVQHNVIELLLRCNKLAHVEVILHLWREFLPLLNFPRSLVLLAKHIILFPDLTDQLRSLLNQVISSADESSKFYDTRLCQAIWKDLDISLIRQALDDEPWTVNEFTDIGFTPLELAIILRRDGLEVVELLLARGADANFPDSSGATPLMVAIGFGNLECIRILSRIKGTLEATDPWGNTALHLAAALNQLETVQLLLTTGSRASVGNCHGETALHSVDLFNSVDPSNSVGLSKRQDEQAAREISRLLLTHRGVDIEAKTCKGNTPALDAVATNRIHVARFFVDEGASLHVINDSGNTLLHIAAASCSLQTLQYLDSLSLSGMDLNHFNINGSTAWDIFQVAIYAPLGYLGHGRRPSIEEQRAFTNLYEGIRNRTAEQDITRLKQVSHALSQGETTTARFLLQTLVEEKRKWANGLHKWYRILAGQVQEGDLDAVVGSIEDYIEELRELIHSSAWDLPSRFTPRPEPEEDRELEIEDQISKEDVDSEDGSNGEEYDSWAGEVSFNGEGDEEDQNRRP